MHTDELVLVRGLHLNEWVGASARSRVSVLERTETAFVHVELLDQDKRRVSDRPSKGQLRDMGSARDHLLTCASIFHSFASRKHLTSSLFLLSRVWCWAFMTVCFCSSGLAFQLSDSGMHLTYMF